MNAIDIWVGYDYAHTDNISRGVTFYERANRVKAIRVYKEKNGYSRERATTMVEVIVCNEDDGTPKQRKTWNSEESAYVEGDYTRHVRARDIFMRWDEYEHERKRRHEQRELIAQQQAEQAVKEEAAKSRLLEALEAKGIPRLTVSTISDYSVSFNRAQLERWLGIDGS